MRNSKSIITICFVSVAMLCASVSGVNAQDNEKNKIGEIGLRFMPTFSQFDVKTSKGGTIKGQATIGFGIGAFLACRISEHVGAQGEVIYSSISQKYSEGNIERTINLRYFNIPLLFSLNTDKDAAVNLNFVAGPQIGMSIGSGIKSSGTDSTITLKPVLGSRKSDLGFAYGFGLDFGADQSKTTRVGIGYRGVYGLFDISDNSGTIATDSYYLIDRSNIRTNSIYMSVSKLF